MPACPESCDRLIHQSIVQEGTRGCSVRPADPGCWAPAKVCGAYRSSSWETVLEPHRAVWMLEAVFLYKNNVYVNYIGGSFQYWKN